MKGGFQEGFNVCQVCLKFLDRVSSSEVFLFRTSIVLRALIWSVPTVIFINH